MKNIILAGKNGYIYFLSDTYEGKAHDKRIADESGYCLPQESILYQDTGFQGFSLENVTVLQPKKKPRNGTLSEQEKEKNRCISSVRVHIEHVICSVKRYRMVKEKIHIYCMEFRDMVMETCCGIHNFRLRYQNKST